MRERWFTRRALQFHLLLVLIVVPCLLAARWQIHQALGGNTLSWAYAFEWPVFAIIAIVGWWQLVHEDPAARAERAFRAALAISLAEAGLDDRPVSAEQSEAFQARVEAAARREYESHVAKLADSELPAWRSSERLP